MQFTYYTERHDRAFIVWRTHRNGKPSVRTFQHRNHPNLRQNLRPENKSKHGNLVVQAEGYGEEHLCRNRVERPRSQYGYIE